MTGGSGYDVSGKNGISKDHGYLYFLTNLYHNNYIMLILFPAIKTYAQHTLETESPHSLYVEESGNPEGIPVLVVHSGPGAGSESYQRRFFDPEKYRIILFDQRGSGKSKPHSELTNNHTAGLLADMEAIRTYLGIERWMLFGGAWGSALSLLYAEKYPEKVTGLILHSIFLARPKDIQWFYQEGASFIFPDYWDDFVQTIPEKERNNVVAAYYQRLNGSDELARMSAVKNWSLWQARCSSLQPHHNVIEHFSDLRFAVGLARVESHYFVNNCFVEPNQILDNIQAIKNIPGYIIHGRYDAVCPLQSAWELHKAWTDSELFIIRDAGHSIQEPGTIDAIILATQKMAHLPLKAC